MAYDLLIKNGILVDGSGRSRYQANIGAVDGRITEIGGKIDGSARKVIDASDLIVAPGFIDPHTHYDAQICWDPLLSCSSWHGVTSVVMGNCGVGLAPCRPDLHEVVTWDLVNVEGIPFDVLSRGISWGWVSFPEFMQAAEQRHSGVNLSFLAPLTPFRHFVMGEESMEAAIGHFDFVLGMSQELDDRFLLAIVHFWKARCLRRRGEYDEALIYTNKGKNIALELGHERMAAVMQVLEGWLLFQQGKWKEALRVTRAAENTLRATDDYVHEHPWASIGIAAGVGVLVGLLINRK